MLRPNLKQFVWFTKDPPSHTSTKEEEVESFEETPKSLDGETPSHKPKKKEKEVDFSEIISAARDIVLQQWRKDGRAGGEEEFHRMFLTPKTDGEDLEDFDENETSEEKMEITPSDPFP